MLVLYQIGTLLPWSTGGVLRGVLERWLQVAVSRGSKVNVICVSEVDRYATR